MGRDYPLALADRAILSRSVARGVERVFFGLAALVIVTWLAGCTGLQQFPATPERYSKALTVLDKDYANALAKIYPDDSTRVEDSKAIQIRNHLIEMRMAVIDAHYRKFVAGLAREDVGVEFGTSLIGIGVGGAGALVSETTSQILSAVSGGLAGAQSAYGKAVLYDRAMTALIAQMDASRAAIATQIFQRWSAGIDSYPLWLARRDLEAYTFAGSLPGAIVATAADAKVKEQQAAEVLSATFAQDLSTQKLMTFVGWDGTSFVNTENKNRLDEWMRQNGLDPRVVTLFLNSKEYAALRAEAVKDLEL